MGIFCRIGEQADQLAGKGVAEAVPNGSRPGYEQLRPAKSLVVSLRDEATLAIIDVVHTSRNFVETMAVGRRTLFQQNLVVT